jgi:hypothetical protein
VNDVEVRWKDPVPQAGSFTLTSPKGRTLTLSFERVDADSIRVTITNGKNTFSFNVNSLGESKNAS